MYGYLVSQEDKSIDTVFVAWMQYVKFAASSREQQIALENTALAAFQGLCRADDSLKKWAKPEDIKRIFFRVSKENLPFGISLWLAHQRLLPALRDARTAAIDKVIGDQFGDLVREESLKGPIAAMKDLGLLLADDLMDIDLRDQGSLILNMSLPSTPVFKKTLEPALTGVLRAMGNQPQEQFNALKNHLWLFTCTRAASQREAALGQMLTLFKQSKSQLLLDADTRAKNRTPPLCRDRFFTMP